MVSATPAPAPRRWRQARAGDDPHSREASNRALVRARHAEPALRSLNREQATAVLAEGPRVLIIAGAGTGKTHAMVARARWYVIERGIAPERIAFVTFTRAAALEINERTPDLRGIESGTLHHLARTIVARARGRIPSLARWANDASARRRMVARWTIEALEEDETLASDLRLRASARHDRRGGRSARNRAWDLAEEIERWVAAVRQGDTDLQHHADTLAAGTTHDPVAALARLGRAVHARWRQALEHDGQTDHQGIVLLATAAVREGALGATPWEAILIDEWQDVSPAQNALVHALADRDSVSGQRPELSMVGDDWQAIYGFQGGDVSLMEAIRSGTDGHAPAETTTLGTTYRYGNALAQCARWWACQSPRAIDKTVHGAVDRAPDPLWPAPIQIAAMTPCDKRRRRPGGGADAAIRIVLERVSLRPGLESIRILARTHQGVMDIEGNAEQRARRILERWEAKPATLPKHLIAQPAETLETDAKRRAQQATGFSHAAVKRHAASLGLGVDIGTIHGAKGCECDVVILLDWGLRKRAADAAEAAWEHALRQLRPHLDTKEDEERRLIYVALTRARHRVYILARRGSAVPALIEQLWSPPANPEYIGEDELSDVLEPAPGTERAASQQGQ